MLARANYLPANTYRAAVRVLLRALMVFAAAAASAVADESPQSPLFGDWVFDENLSDDVEDAFHKKLFSNRPRSGPPAGATPARDRTAGDLSQEHYWKTLNESRNRKESKNLRRLGTVYPLLTAERLAIGAERDGLLMLYDNLLPRDVRPNPGGRVFSASGDELTNDTIGYTLTYWDKGQLVLETDSPTGGKYVEKISVGGNKDLLEYRIEVRSFVLKEKVAVKRIFRREGKR